MSTSTIGKKLRQARLDRKISQSAFAATVGKSKQLASAWENGRAEILVSDLLMLSRVFDLDLADLLGIRQKAGSDRGPINALTSANTEFFSYWSSVAPTLSKLINSKLKISSPSATGQLNAIKLVIAALNQLASSVRK